MIPGFEPYNARALAYYRRDGQGGPRVHFAHANGFNAPTYGPLFALFPPELEVHGVDQRGHGASAERFEGEPEGLLSSWDIYVQDLLAFLDRQDGKTLLMGHSLGATVSLLAAQKRPDKVLGLILLEPVLMPPWLRPILSVADVFNRRDRIFPQAVATRRRRTHFESKAEILGRYQGKSIFKTWQPGFLEGYVEGGFVADGERGVTLACRRAWEFQTFAKTPSNPLQAIHDFTLPTLVLRGEKQSTCPPLSHRELKAKIPHLVSVTVGGTSHFLPMERPRMVAEALRSFLALLDL